MGPWELIGYIANIGGAVSALVSALGVLRLLHNRRRSAERIRIVLTSEDGTHEVPVHLRRGELSRSELMGRMRGLAGGKEFNIGAFGQAPFFSALDDAIQGKTSTIIVAATPAEIQGFKQLCETPVTNTALPGAGAE